MNKYKSFAPIIIVFISLIFLHNSIINLLGNINSWFKKDNSLALEQTYYLEKIEYLERSLSDYEKGLNNLKIYNSQNYILSKLSIRNIYEFYDYIIVSTSSKVEKGNPVINEHGLIGIVESANKKTAKVNLLTGINSLSVRVGSSYGILKKYDKEKKLFIIHNINNYQIVNIGDEVTTSGLTDIKSNIKIGTVENIKKEGIEQIVYVKSDVDFDELNYLYVIK